MAGHTPGKLSVSDTSIVSEHYCIAVIEEDGGYEAPAEERDANAARFVLTWNCHDALVEACKAAEAQIAVHGLGDKNIYESQDILRLVESELLKQLHAAAALATPAASKE